MNVWIIVLIVYAIGLLGWLIWDVNQYNGATGPLHWFWVTLRTIAQVTGILFILGLLLSIFGGVRDKS